jgi:pimeloyl-ACP methyl ester carboxylesterase
MVRLAVLRIMVLPGLIRLRSIRHHQAHVAVLLAVAICAGLSSTPVALAEVLEAPGTLISAQAIVTPNDEKALAWRVRYVSTDPYGKRIEATGTVFAPVGAARTRDVVVWAHPTSGVMPACAPSRRSGPGYPWIAGLQPLLAAGFVITAPDYAGLGTSGVHPYLVGASEARAVVDSVRAARAIGDAHAGNRYIVWGHSQGAHAALWTAMLPAAYAPDVALEGVAAAAPPTDLATNVARATDRNGILLVASYLFVGWSNFYHMPLASALKPATSAAVREVAHVCSQTPRDAVKLATIIKPLQQLSLPAAFDRDERWKAHLMGNSTGLPTRRVPYFIAQGMLDELIVPGVTTAYVKALCKAGMRVDYDQLPGINHPNSGADAAPAAVRWMQGRFAGTPAPSNC